MSARLGKSPSAQPASNHRCYPADASRHEIPPMSLASRSGVSPSPALISSRSASRPPARHPHQKSVFPGSTSRCAVSFFSPLRFFLFSSFQCTWVPRPFLPCTCPTKILNTFLAKFAFAFPIRYAYIAFQQYSSALGQGAHHEPSPPRHLNISALTGLCRARSPGFICPASPKGFGPSLLAHPFRDRVETRRPSSLLSRPEALSHSEF